MTSPDDAKTACECGEGITALTPVTLYNRPGLSALGYRVGTHVSFKQTMLAGISATRALRHLTTRDDSDPSIALLDAWAVVLDILSFYQERFADEGFLRTAVERRSLLELARTIGYELRPGVAASTYLSWVLDETPDSPKEVVIPAGTRAQSVPASENELPQAFESDEEIVARPEWNALKPARSELHKIRADVMELYLKGVDTLLQPGDGILLVGDTRERHLGSERWDFRILTEVETLSKEDITRVAWEPGLGHKGPTVRPADNPRVFAFRQRAALFGYNAPDWRAMPTEIKDAYKKDEKERSEWPDFVIRTVSDAVIDLDAVYPKITPGSWVVLEKPSYTELYKVLSVDAASRTDFTLTAKTTRLKLDVREHLSWFPLRETVVFAQSEQLAFAERPRTDPVGGQSIVLDRVVEGLEPGRSLVVRGKRPRAKLGKGVESLRIDAVEGGASVVLSSGELLQVMAPPSEVSPAKWTWLLRDGSGFEGTVTVGSETIALEPALEDDAWISEAATLRSATPDKERTTLTLEEPLRNIYDRTSTSVHGNVTRASHGETRREILGGGDASRRFQSFELRQTPLTYVSAPVASGSESTLELRVNTVRWYEAPDLLRLGPGDHKFVLRRADDGTTSVRFGDGVHGTRLPTGSDNVQVTYRIGIGAAGNLGEIRISLLAAPPLGVRSVSNPLPAIGGQDPETRESARRNTPTTVLTLDRIVSLQDFEDFARAFAGVDKAWAVWLWDGEARRVHVTVAAASGQPLPKNAELYENLVEAMNQARDPFQHLGIDSYEPVYFRISGKVQVNPDYRVDAVLQAVEERLRATFSFEARDFGQAVALSEVTAEMQGVEGVTAVNVTQLYLGNQASPSPAAALFALPARLDTRRTVRPAQLLTLAPEPVELERMA